MKFYALIATLLPVALALENNDTISINATLPPTLSPTPAATNTTNSTLPPTLSPTPAGTNTTNSTLPPTHSPTYSTGGDDNSTSVGIGSNGIYAKVLGKSGKITVGREEDPSADPGAITITMDSMTEVNGDGKAVGTTGKSKHSFNSFASQDFEFGSIYTTTLGNATADAFDFNATLLDQAELKVTAYMIGTGGEFKLNANETYNLTVGTFKFDISLENWPFCGTEGFDCKKGGADEVGEFVDIDIEIKGVDSPSKVDGEEKQYSIGDGVTVDVSNEVEVDGEWTVMPEGYPKVTEKGGKQIFTFRFPKFTEKAKYDPIIGFEESNDTSTPSPPPTMDQDNGAISNNCASIFAMLVILTTTMFF